jgi:hypothetical protein
MPEGVAEEPKNWLQLYVDAMTEKDPYKRLALVRRLRQVPKPASPKPSLPRVAAPKAALRRQKAKAVSKTHKGSARLRSA